VTTALEHVGRSAIGGVEDAGALTLQLGRALLTLPRILPVAGKRRRWRTAVQQMLNIGVAALPMAALMSFCIGYVLALQSAAELRRFSALQFVIDLLSIGFTRELGALITALALSGRTASAIAAEVATMAVTEEIDALRVMGLDPVEFTLAPKYLGALITVPCLTVLSTFCGIAAGYLFLASSIDISLRVYFHEVVDSILLRDVWLTLIKSVVFATIIVQVGYAEGLRARGGPEAVGTAATRAVGKSTFLVIVADLVATAMFYLMGWSAVR
jgi:phospholipid/cholesterol/gamma-HCH transport system permease protein